MTFSKPAMAQKTMFLLDDEEEEDDDELNDLSDLLSPLNQDVIDRELSELASNNGNWSYELSVAELTQMVSFSDELSIFSPLKNMNESPMSRQPSILKKNKRQQMQQQMFEYATPPSMKKSRLMLTHASAHHWNNNINATPSPLSKPLSTINNHYDSLNPKLGLEFSPSQVRTHSARYYYSFSYLI